VVGADWIDNREDQIFIDGRPMAFGPGHDTGGEPGSVRRKSRVQCTLPNPRR
jgi:hypothetical protein